MIIQLEKFNHYLLQKDKKYIIFIYKLFIKYLKERNLFFRFNEKFNINEKQSSIDIYRRYCYNKKVDLEKLKEIPINNLLDFLTVRYICIGEEAFKTVFDKTLVYHLACDKIQWNVENARWAKFYNKLFFENKIKFFLSK